MYKKLIEAIASPLLCHFGGEYHGLFTAFGSSVLVANEGCVA